MPRARGNGPPKGYLVAEPAGFPGLRIPLLSDEECAARGISPGRFPPREEWTQAQRDAADRLTDILRPYLLREVLQIILAELEREPHGPDVIEGEAERAAARRGIQLVDAGKWKQRDTFVNFPPSWVRDVLEMFASGAVSLTEPPKTKRRRKVRR